MENKMSEDAIKKQEELEKEKDEANKGGEDGEKGDKNKGKDDGASGSDDKNKDDKSGGGGKTFTQEEVNRLLAKEKNEGRRSVLKELGITVAPGKAGTQEAVSKMNQFFDSLKTEEEKKADGDTRFQAEKQEAERRALRAEAKVEALVLEAKPENLDEIIDLAEARMSKDPDKEIKLVLSELKTKLPSLFKEGTEEEQNKAGKKGTGGAAKSDKEKKTVETEGLGKRLAEMRKPKVDAERKKYFGN